MALRSVTNLENGTKVCPRCTQEKPLTEYRVVPGRGSGGFSSYCYDCTREYQAVYQRARRSGATPEEREASAAWFRNYRKERPEAVRASMLRQSYGMDLDDYERIYDAQGGVCKICGTPDPGGRWNSSLCVDHDHATGFVRGLLCHDCNVGLGFFDDSPEKMMAALQYLLETSGIDKRIRGDEACA